MQISIVSSETDIIFIHKPHNGEISVPFEKEQSSSLSVFGNFFKVKLLFAEKILINIEVSAQ